MKKITKDYLLICLKQCLTRGLFNLDKNNNTDALIQFGKCQFILNVLLHCFDFDLKSSSDLTSVDLWENYVRLNVFVKEV